MNRSIKVENTDVDGVPARQAQFNDKSCAVAALLDPKAKDQAVQVDFTGDDACDTASDLVSTVIDRLPG